MDAVVDGRGEAGRSNSEEEGSEVELSHRRQLQPHFRFGPATRGLPFGATSPRKNQGPFRHPALVGIHFPPPPPPPFTCQVAYPYRESGGPSAEPPLGRPFSTSHPPPPMLTMLGTVETHITHFAITAACLGARLMPSPIQNKARPKSMEAFSEIRKRIPRDEVVVGDRGGGVRAAGCGWTGKVSLSGVSTSSVPKDQGQGQPDRGRRPK